jgi:SRSO17 transposase
MQLPIVAPAPVVSEHAPAFEHLFSDVRQFRHFQHYLTALIVLENKSLANISRCILESADKSNLSRFLTDSPWDWYQVNSQRIVYLLSQTESKRGSGSASELILDDTLCEHVGSLFEHVERHYNHTNQSYPLSHNLVTSFYRSREVHFPLHFQLYRRYESVTQWETYVLKYFPEQTIPKTAQERAKLHKQLDPELLKDQSYRDLHEQFMSKIEIAKLLVEQAIDHHLPFSMVLMDSWYLSSELVAMLSACGKDWVSLIKSNRKIETASFQLKDAQGNPISLPTPAVRIDELVPLIPASAYQKIDSADRNYWCFTFCVRIQGLGKVRLVISFDNAALQGTYAVLISNRTNLAAKELLVHYLHRWPIETFYRDSKQLLGLNDYRTRPLEANHAHWCLVFVAYSFLHLESLALSSTKGRGKPPSKPHYSIGDICRQQTQALIEKLILFAHNQLQKGLSTLQVFSHLFAKQHNPRIRNT